MSKSTNICCLYQNTISTTGPQLIIHKCSNDQLTKKGENYCITYQVGKILVSDHNLTCIVLVLPYCFQLYYSALGPLDSSVRSNMMGFVKYSNHGDCPLPLPHHHCKVRVKGASVQRVAVVYYCS